MSRIYHRFGSPLGDRVWDRSVRDPETGCVEWQGTRNKRGYGFLKANNRRISAHRLAYEVAFGAIPDGLFVCHRCDNPSCVNPDHLFLGTAKDNSQDALSKGRLAIPYTQHGVGHHFAKLNLELAAKIRSELEAGAKPPILAKKYGVGRSTIYRVRDRKVWA